MERFEVALILDERRLLVPSMLPRDRPGLRLPGLRQTPNDEDRSASVDSSEVISGKMIYCLFCIS